MIGILALQGAFIAHADQLTALKQPWMLIKKPEDLNQVDGLIIPGGESSTLLKLLTHIKLDTAIEKFGKEGKPILGTCAGMILLAKKVIPSQKSLNLIDITVQRNAYGRQIDSFMAAGEITSSWQFAGNQHHQPTIELVFIRAPAIISLDSPTVTTLITYQNQPILVQQNNILAASFHPELTDDNLIHEYFLSLL